MKLVINFAGMTDPTSQKLDRSLILKVQMETYVSFQAFNWPEYFSATGHCNSCVERQLR